MVWDGRFTVVSNGTHTRPIFERLKAGHSPRDAMAGVLMGLDREFDQHDTPRICGVFDAASDSLWLGSITATSLALMPLTVAAGQMAYVTTYERPLPSSSQVDGAFDPQRAAGICQHVVGGSIFADFDKAICAAATVIQIGGSRRPR